MAKAKKSKAKKSKAKKSKAKKTKARSRRAASASRGPARKAKAKKSKARKPKRAAAKASKPKTKAKKAAPKKKQPMAGEGDYQASRSFLKDQGDFVKRHSSEIPGMGKAAEAALEGPQGDQLRAAEDEARGHSKAAGE
ncbi:MAG TPA: hypothetical protein VN685_00160 [Rhizomicrobium sp.]|nr:hypothetical protein [Rhizomicrobium sp.]